MDPRKPFMSGISMFHFILSSFYYSWINQYNWQSYLAQGFLKSHALALFPPSGVTSTAGDLELFLVFPFHHMRGFGHETPR